MGLIRGLRQQMEHDLVIRENLMDPNAYIDSDTAPTKWAQGDFLCFFDSIIRLRLRVTAGVSIAARGRGPARRPDFFISTRLVLPKTPLPRRLFAFRETTYRKLAKNLVHFFPMKICLRRSLHHGAHGEGGLVPIHLFNFALDPAKGHRSGLFRAIIFLLWWEEWNF
jgi:hypothetical protein